MGTNEDLERKGTKSSIAHGTSQTYSEYDEYVRLSQVFTGDRLKKLARKIE